MVDFDTISIVLTGMGLIVAITYYGFQIRNQNRTRQAQLFMSIYNNHISIPSMTIMQELQWEWNWKDYDDFVSKYSLPNNMEALVKFSHYFASLEGLGVLCKKGLIDPELVYDSQYTSIIHNWEKFLPIIEELRIRMNAPHLYEDPEYLYEQMITIREKRGHQPMTPSSDLFTK